MSSSTHIEKERLLVDLKESVDSQVRLLKVPSAREDVRRYCALQVLDAVVSFLKSWDELQNTASRFPNGVIRDAFSILLAEMGPGDAQVRARILETIPSIVALEGRQALLDVMPWTMPVDPKELEEATQQVLDVLREVLLGDSEALLPVLGCLSLLPLSQKGRAEAWNVALASLPVVSETDLPVLARTLLCNVSTKEDASRALHAIRTEFAYVQSATDYEEDPMPLIAHVLLGGFQDRENGVLVAKAYLDVLKSISTEERSDLEEEDEESNTFLVLDAVAVLALYQNCTVKSDVESLMDDWIKKETFPFSTFHLLLKTICHRRRPGEPASVLYNRLVPSLLSLALFLLLTPVRSGPNRNQLMDVHRLIFEFHRGLDRDYQDELVQCLLHLSEETSWDRDRMVGKKRRVRSRKDLGEFSKREGLKMTADTVHALLQQMALTARSSVARFKHILVERLTAVPNDSALDDLHSIEQLCTILSCLVEPTIAEPGSGIGIDASEVMMLLQKLLFTASYSTDRRSLRRESTLDVGRIIRGLILSTELIKSEALSYNDKECIHQWVHRILLPSTRRTVDPEIGSHGLRFLSAWSSWLENSSTDGALKHSTGNDQAYGMFQSFKMILANTGLIQMQTLYLERRKRPDEVVLGYTSIPSSFLRYSDPSAKHNKRDMIFCIHSYVRTSNVKHPSRWEQMTRWVFDLVDTYLTMGREGTYTGSSKQKSRTKWLPDGWLEASLELPTLNLAMNKAGNKTKVMAELLSSELCKHEVTFWTAPISKAACNEVVTGLCEEKDIGMVIERVESVMRVTLSFVLGIGLSAAVLRNANAHLLSLDDIDGGDVKSSSQGDESRRCREIVKLMQYQMMKLYDLKRKSETSIRFLEAFVATIRRGHVRGKQRGGGRVEREQNVTESDGEPRIVADSEATREASKIASAAEAACHHTRQILELMFSSPDFIAPEILMKCLVDAGDESILMEGLQAQSETANPLYFKTVVELRKRMLVHLSNVYPESTMHGSPIRNGAVADVVNVITTASLVSKMLPAFRKTAGREKHEKDNDDVIDSDHDSIVITAVDASGLSSSYFRLVKKILIKATNESNIAGINARLNVSATLDNRKSKDEDHLPGSQILLDALVQYATKMNAVELTRAVTTKVDGSVIDFTFNIFLDHLRICEDEATALELLDILSILSSGSFTLTELALEACWRALHTVYTTSHRAVFGSKCNDLPLVFEVSSSCPDRTQMVQRILAATIVKTVASETKNSQDSTMLRHGVLLLWGLNAQSPSKTVYLSLDYLSKLTTELVEFLDGIDCSSSLSTSGDKPAQQKRERSQRLERRTKRDRPRFSSITGLTLASFDSLFELLLHAAVASFAVSPHARTTDQRFDAKAGKSPFQHHHDMIQLISRILDVYISYFHLFPRRMLSIVLGACKHLLSTCLFQVEECVQWRNAQPILSVEQKRAGVHDFGSIKFLEQLLQTFATWGAGKVMTVCQMIRQLSSPSVESDGDEDEDFLAILPQNDKRFTTLMLAAQKTMDTFRDVASAHNLVPPKSDVVSLEKLSSEEAEKKRVAADDMDKGYHVLDWNESVLVENEEDRVKPKKKRRRVIPFLVSNRAQCVGTPESTDDIESRSRKRHPVIEEDEECKSDDSESQSTRDDESQRSSDAFGVSGKWGDDKSDDAEEESSSGSLELEVTNIFQAA